MGMNQFTAVSCLIRGLSHQRDGSSSCWPRLEVSAIMESGFFGFVIICIQ